MPNPSIIVPYRNRVEHLAIFIPAMRAYLPNADIIVVEQVDDKPFNRGKLFNAAAWEFPEPDYYIFHDVDKIPIEVDYSFELDYSVPAYVVQLEKSNIQVKDYFGGVTIFGSTIFFHNDGFSNNFWGWGGEDNEMHRNVIKHGLEIKYRNCTFKSLPHKINGTFDMAKWKQSQRPRSKDDGIGNCRYALISKEQKAGYTLIKVEL